MPKQSKGSDYEREICERLSRWWTNGKRDDIFYRSSGSGARATARSSRGKQTAHQHGDVACTDPCGALLTDLFNIEIKRGYSDATSHELLDRSQRTLPGWYEQWVVHCIEGCRSAGTFGWLLITRRDRRRPLIWMSVQTYSMLLEMGVGLCLCSAPSVTFTIEVRGKDRTYCVQMYGTSLDNFLDAVSREAVERLGKIV